MLTFFNLGDSEQLLTYLLYGVAYLMAIFVAMPFHEFAHAFVAKKEGDYTASALKRCTLAPFAHIDIKGFVCLILFGFGWAKPVPVDDRNFKRGRLSSFLVSIAGITVNLILGTIFLFLFMVCEKYFYNFINTNLYGTLLYLFLYISFNINFSLAVFNLLPIYPLDGFRIIESFSRYNSGFVQFMKKYSLVFYFIIIFTRIFSIYYTYTAGTLIYLLEKLFSLILGV